MSAALSLNPTDPAEATVSDLVTMALQQIGVGAQGTTASALDIASGVRQLNLMLGVWQRQRWMIPNLTDYACVSRGLLSYTVGYGGDIAPGGSRPDEIDSCYIRWLGNVGYTQAAPDFGSNFTTDFSLSGGALTANTPQVGGPYVYDYPLQEIESREDYSTIRVKALATWPQAFYYSPDFPAGTLYVWPVPLYGQWEIHIVTKAALPANLTATSVINLPPEYQDAIMWCLAQRLAPSYGQTASEDVKQFARAALQTIQGANTQIPALEMPAEILPRWGYGAPWWFGGGTGGAVTGPASTSSSATAQSGFTLDSSTLDVNALGSNPPDFAATDFTTDFVGGAEPDPTPQTGIGNFAIGEDGI